MDEYLRSLLDRARNHVMTPEERVAQRESFARAMKAPRDDDLSPEELASRRAEGAKIDDGLKWTGSGPMPASWMVGNTKVYRSFADAVDD